jgi:hypothetical protein
MYWTGSGYGQVAAFFEHGNENVQVTQTAASLLTNSETISFSRRALLYGVIELVTENTCDF